jgi:dienelactone hydrolase
MHLRGGRDLLHGQRSRAGICGLLFSRLAGETLILLFHQAGSNRGEYATIGPALATLGFNALAIDQRSGGNAWGRTNETVKRLGKSTGYDEALLDLEAALQWAESSGQTGSIIVWGSSYSAALVFLLAAEHRNEIKAILAFSPGEYLRGSATVRKAAAQVSIPIFVTSAKDPKENLDAPKRSEPRWSRRKLGGGQTIFSQNSPPSHPRGWELPEEA